MSGGGVGNTTNTGSVGGLGGAMGQPRPQVLPQVAPQVQRPTQSQLQTLLNTPGQVGVLGGMGISGATGGMPAQGGMPPQLGSQIQSLLNTPGQVGQLGGMPTLRQDPRVAELIRQGNMQGARDLVDSLAIQNGKDIVPRPLGGMPFQGGVGGLGGIGQAPFQAPNGNFGVPGGMGLGGVGQVQQALGGPPIQMDLSQDAYRRFLAQAQFSGQPPTYDQWVQQRSAQRPIPQVFPQKPGVPGFGLSTAMQPYFQELAQQAVQQPQVFPQKPGLSTTMQPRPQVSPPNPGLGLAGLANALQGQYK